LGALCDRDGAQYRQATKPENHDRAESHADYAGAALLDEKAKKNLEQMLFQIFKKKVILEVSVHPELIAGLMIQAGDMVLDHSLKSQLNRMKLRFGYDN